MTATEWNEVAAGLARHVRGDSSPAHRGALMLTSPADNTAVAALFGNDDYAGDERSRRAAEFLRAQLCEAGVEELGFGLSDDGEAWALLIRARMRRFRTAAGNAFAREMWTASLEDIVREAWQRAAADL
jgi:hypothetical protein